MTAPERIHQRILKDYMLYTENDNPYAAIGYLMGIITELAERYPRCESHLTMVEDTIDELERGGPVRPKIELVVNNDR